MNLHVDVFTQNRIKVPLELCKLPFPVRKPKRRMIVEQNPLVLKDAQPGYPLELDYEKAEYKCRMFLLKDSNL